MTSNLSSDTFTYLYYNVIEELMYLICEKNINCSVKQYIGKDTMPIALQKKYDEYKDKALNNMYGGRLDRHKLASSVCGAIAELKPIIPVTGKEIQKNSNEIFAIHAGLTVIKFFMLDDFVVDELKITEEAEKANMRDYFMANFDMKFPDLSDNICDNQEYRQNLYNALFWNNPNSEHTQKESFHYDVWAYATIFYHLESYNQERLKREYQKYLEQKEKQAS